MFQKTPNHLYIHWPFCKNKCHYCDFVALEKHNEFYDRYHEALKKEILKGFDEDGFVFFTNYESNKASDIASTQQASLTFWWDKLHRQIRIRGTVEKVTRKESEEYFYSRPRGSQIGAVASKQSEVIQDYAFLENEYKTIEDQYQNQEIPCPQHWGGYRVMPVEFEFWQGRPNRLHDRMRYSKTNTDWKIERLSP